ncbi:MAG: hypothetical protein QW816_06915 [Desulfurococcaceae archaeon]
MPCLRNIAILGASCIIEEVEPPYSECVVTLIATDPEDTFRTFDTLTDVDDKYRFTWTFEKPGCGVCVCLGIVTKITWALTAKM